LGRGVGRDRPIGRDDVAMLRELRGETAEILVEAGDGVRHLDAELGGCRADAIRVHQALARGLEDRVDTRVVGLLGRAAFGAEVRDIAGTVDRRAEDLTEAGGIAARGRAGRRDAPEDHSTPPSLSPGGIAPSAALPMRYCGT